LSPADKADLLGALSTFPKGELHIAQTTVSNSKVAKHLRFYEPLRQSGERDIWEKQKAFQQANVVTLPDDERVEDAGLELDPLTMEA
jgi:hypothetical protein